MSDELDFSLDVTVSGVELLSGTGRPGRIGWVAQRIRKDDFFLLQDGVFSKLLFNETIECFVGGQFIATIVLGFSLIERAIAGRLSHVGDKKAAKGRSEELMVSALNKGWLSQTEFDHIKELRALRNPVVHFREHLDKSRPEFRATVNEQETSQMLESDARRILEAAIHVLGKTAI